MAGRTAAAAGPGALVGCSQGGGGAIAAAASSPLLHTASRMLRRAACLMLMLPQRGRLRAVAAEGHTRRRGSARQTRHRYGQFAEALKVWILIAWRFARPLKLFLRSRPITTLAPLASGDKLGALLCVREL